MASGALSIKLRCASWQQLATIYQRDLSLGTMFLRAATPPPVGTAVRIDLALPSATVIALDGVVERHVQDPQRGTGVALALSPIPPSSVWLIESALASEHRRLAAPTRSTPSAGAHPVPGPIPAISENAEVAVAEQELIQALASEAESLRKLDPFLVLGVGYEASDAEVRAAFGELTKRYHPDRFARYESAELREVAAEIFILIRDAYRRIGDAVSRAQVLPALDRSSPSRAAPVPPRTSLRSPVVPATSVPAMTVPVPAAIRPTAAHAARAPAGMTAPAPATIRLPADARPVVRHHEPGASDRRTPAGQTTAAGIDPAGLAALEDLIDQGRLDEALSGYRLLGKRHPHDRNARAGVELCEGLLALTARDRPGAAHRFESALEVDPSNERAARALAEMRRQATHERKGLLSRLMGKQEP
jgi:DnaJ-domain-containing protein 1